MELDRYRRPRPELAGEHLLDGLSRDAKFPGDIGLGEAFFDELMNQFPPLGRQLPQQSRLLQRLVPNLSKVTEHLRVRGDCVVGCHATIVTTPRCRVNPRLSTSADGHPAPATQLHLRYCVRRADRCGPKVWRRRCYERALWALSTWLPEARVQPAIRGRRGAPC